MTVVLRRTCLACLLLVAASPLSIKAAPQRLQSLTQLNETMSSRRSTQCWPDGPIYSFCQQYGPVVESGEGKNWSQWFAMTSDPRPGLELISAAFWLHGPHSCHGTESHPVRVVEPRRPGGSGNWAECYEAQRDSDTVTWRYRIQGRDEVQIWDVLVLLLAPAGGPNGAVVTADFKLRRGTVVGTAQLVTRYQKKT
jgi:hypothetical protein